MLLTEEEAKERWCPFVRYLAVFRNHHGDRETAGCFNRGGADSGLEKACCIASQCMAWRWQPLQADQPFMDAVKKRMDDAKEAHPKAVKYVRANLVEFDLPTEPFRGHCGLAGKPEA